MFCTKLFSPLTSALSSVIVSFFVLYCGDEVLYNQFPMWFTENVVNELLFFCSVCFSVLVIVQLYLMNEVHNDLFFLVCYVQTPACDVF